MNTTEEIQRSLKTQLASAQTELAAATERCEMLKLGIARLEGYGEALQVIRKASNPNAETVQSYPSGRWTEKGTV